jgi:hypothetical protein
LARFDLSEEVRRIGKLLDRSRNLADNVHSALKGDVHIDVLNRARKSAMVGFAAHED